MEIHFNKELAMGDNYPRYVVDSPQVNQNGGFTVENELFSPVITGTTLRHRKHTVFSSKTAVIRLCTDSKRTVSFDLGRYAGRSYLCVHNQGESIDKHKHHSLFIDVAGESRTNAIGEIDSLCGLMLNVTANSSGQTKFCHRKAVVSGKKDSIYVLGQLTNTQYQTPRLWAFHLLLIADKIYTDLVENNSDKEQWTAKLNCQLFAQKLIERLDLNYPSNILTCSDIPPTLVDISILSFRLSARSREKLRPTRRSTSQ